MFVPLNEMLPPATIKSFTEEPAVVVPAISYNSLLPFKARLPLIERVPGVPVPAILMVPLVERLPTTSLPAPEVRPACNVRLLPRTNVPLFNPDTSNTAPEATVTDELLA